MKKVFIYNCGKNAQNYINAISKTGAQAIVSTDISLAKDCTHLLLCGGGDVLPFFYGKGVENCSDLNQSRDLAEIYLINYFFKKNLPILGICRGMQIINVCFGGTLKQKIIDKDLHYSPKSDLYHPIEICKGFLADIYNDNQLTVNSAHIQCVDNCAKDFFVNGYSYDFIPESFQHKNAKIFGVQFHPERMGNFGGKIYDYFVNLS